MVVRDGFEGCSGELGEESFDFLCADCPIGVGVEVISDLFHLIAEGRIMEMRFLTLWRPWDVVVQQVGPLSVVRVAAPFRVRRHRLPPFLLDTPTSVLLFTPLGRWTGTFLDNNPVVTAVNPNSINSTQI
jgi:hypothetical protein